MKQQKEVFLKGGYYHPRLTKDLKVEISRSRLWKKASGKIF